MGPRAIVAAALSLGLTTLGAASGGSGTLSGRVLDAAGAEPLHGVLLRLAPDGLLITSDADGRFAFHGLPPGTYHLEAIRIGFRTASAGPFELDAGERRVELRMERRPPEERIIVRPDQPPGEPGPYPAGMTREEVERLPGTLDDPLRALTALPGVSGINDRKAEVRLRGGDPDETLFRLDGVDLESPFHFRGAKASVAALNGDAFDRFTLHLTGIQAGVGNTISGAVELFPSERGADGGFLDLSLGTLASRASAGGPLDGGGSWLAAARYSSTDLYKGLYGVSQQHVPDFGDLYLRARQPLLPGLDLVAGSLGFTSRARQLDDEGALRSDLESTSFLAYVGLDDARREDLRLHGRLAWNRFAQQVEGEGGALRIDEGRIGLRLQAEGGPADRPRWRAGLSTAQNDARIDGAVGYEGPPGRLSARGHRGGLFGTVLLRPAERWTLELGLRTDRDSRFGWAPLQPRVRAEYRPADRWRLELAAARYAQFPRSEQEFLAQGEALAAARAEELAAGVSVTLPRHVDLGLTVFHRRLDDLTAEVVNLYPDLAEPMGRFESGRNDGVELSVRRSRGRLQGWLSLAALRARASRDGREVLRNGDQPYQADLSLLYLLGERWSLGARYRAASGLPYTPYLPVEPGVRALGPLNGARLPATSRLDLRASWGRRGNLTETRFYLEIENLLGRENLRTREVRWDDRRQSFKVVESGTLSRVPAFGVEIRWGR